MGSPRVRYDLATERRKHDDYKEMYYVNHLVEYLLYNAYLTVVTIINGFYTVQWEIRGINGESVHVSTCDTLYLWYFILTPKPTLLPLHHIVSHFKKMNSKAKPKAILDLFYCHFKHISAGCHITFEMYIYF